MSNKNETKKEPNKLKVYGIAILIYLIVLNPTVELAMDMWENQLDKPLFPAFPYTRIALLIITILVAQFYIERKSSKPKKRGWFFRISKYTILTVIFIGLAYGAFFSVEFYDPTPFEPIEYDLPPIPEPIEIEKQNIGQ